MPFTTIKNPTVFSAGIFFTNENNVTLLDFIDREYINSDASSKLSIYYLSPIIHLLELMFSSGKLSSAY